MQEAVIFYLLIGFVTSGLALAICVSRDVEVAFDRLVINVLFWPFVAIGITIQMIRERV